MAKKRIIHLIQALDSGGCENALLRTLPLMKEFEHIVVTLKKNGELAEKFKTQGISVIDIGMKNLLDVPAYFRLLKTVRVKKPKLIMTYLFHADLVGRLFLQLFVGTKIIPSLRTTYDHRKFLFARIFERLSRHCVKNYLANSESVKAFYEKNIGISPDKISVIPNGIDAEFYGSQAKDEKLRESLGIKPFERAIICVANLHEYKGHRYLLEAFEEIYKKNKDVKLLIVGSGREKEKLLRQTASYGSRENILFLGKRSDVPDLLKISDIFVLPTLFEGMSNAIMEAMAAGLPVITTSIKENECLIENNTNGILCSPSSAKELQAAMIRLLDNEPLRLSLGRNAQKTVSDEFGISKISQKLSEFYLGHI